MSGAPVQVEVSVDRCPPSLNDVAGQGTRYRWIAAKKLWYRDLAPALAAAGMVRCDTVYVEGLITFPNRRKRDQGNYRAPLEKFLGDALQRGGYLPDDDWAHYQFGDLQAGYEFREGWMKGLSILLQVNNVTNEAYQEFFRDPGTPDRPRSYNEYGRTYLLGATYKF